MQEKKNKPPQQNHPSLIKPAYLDINKSFMVLPIAPLEAPVGCGQLFLCIIQAIQLFQAEVAPHYIQLQDCIVINCVQQLRAALTGKTKHLVFLGQWLFAFWH